MMKLGGRCIVQKSRPNSNLGVIAPRACTPPKCGIWLWHWKNQHMLSSVSSVVTTVPVVPRQFMPIQDHAACVKI